MVYMIGHACLHGVKTTGCTIGHAYFPEVKTTGYKIAHSYGIGFVIP